MYNYIDSIYEKIASPIKKFIINPFLNAFERYIWNPMLNHYKITTTVLWSLIALMFASKYIL